MGQALLAELWRGEDLVRAHDLAKDGAAAHPSSPGGQACLSIQKQIEAPDYSLEGMATDAPGQRSILVTHRNLGEIHFRAWELDLSQRLETAKDYNLLYSGYQEVRRLLRGTPPTASWSVKLPGTPDYRSHKTYVTPPMQKSGWYFIAASAKSDFSEDHNRAMALNFFVTDLVLITRVTETGSVEVRVVSGKSGQPVANAEVELWRYDWQKHHSRVESRRSDAEGLVTFGVHEGNAHFVVARKGGEHGARRQPPLPVAAGDAGRADGGAGLHRSQHLPAAAEAATGRWSPTAAAPTRRKYRVSASPTRR